MIRANETNSTKNPIKINPIFINVYPATHIIFINTYDIKYINSFLLSFSIHLNFI